MYRSITLRHFITCPPSPRTHKTQTSGEWTFGQLGLIKWKAGRKLMYKRNIWVAVLQLLLPWKSNSHYIFWVCVFSFTYPTCKAHAPYYMVVCDLSGCTNFFFSPNLINGTIFWENISWTQMYFFISCKILSAKFPILKINQCVIINLHTCLCLCKIPFILLRL